MTQPKDIGRPMTEAQRQMLEAHRRPDTSRDGALHLPSNLGDPRSDALRAAWKSANEKQWGRAITRAWQARAKAAAKSTLPPNIIRFGGAAGE